MDHNKPAWFLKVTNMENTFEQGNCWKRGMLPKCLLSIKGRSCHQTPLVY